MKKNARWHLLCSVLLSNSVGLVLYQKWDPNKYFSSLCIDFHHVSKRDPVAPGKNRTVTPVLTQRRTLWLGGSYQILFNAHWARAGRGRFADRHDMWVRSHYVMSRKMHFDHKRRRPQSFLEIALDIDRLDRRRPRVGDNFVTPTGRRVALPTRVGKNAEIASKYGILAS